MPAESLDMDGLQHAIAALTSTVTANTTSIATNAAAITSLSALTSAVAAVLNTLSTTPSYANDVAAAAGGVTTVVDMPIDSNPPTITVKAMHAKADAAGQPLDGSKHNYTLTFAAGQYPPVNAFWSVTMYDGKTQLLIENPINRYLINSPMLPTMKKIVQTPRLMLILDEYNASYRQIFIDGRPLPEDPQPSWMGYSSGRWDGDTLVVESLGFREDQWLDAGRSPMTSAAKVTERFRRINYGNLEIEITVNDPKAYTRPWTVVAKQVAVLDTDLLDAICLENEKDLPHLPGK